MMSNLAMFAKWLRENVTTEKNINAFQLSSYIEKFCEEEGKREAAEEERLSKLTNILE